MTGSNYEIMNSKVNVLDNHFEELVSQSYNKFKIIKENIKALSNQFEEEKLKEEHSLEKKMNYYPQLFQKLILSKNYPIEKIYKDVSLNGKQIVNLLPVL